MKVPIEVSARHIHLTIGDCIKLFGSKDLTKFKDLSQPNQFAAKETITLIGPHGEIKDVRVIAPHRNETQVEISITDSFTLGIDPPPVLISGKLENSVGGVTLKGASGEIKLDKGIIVAKRHLHISPEQAKKNDLKHLECIKIKTTSERSLIFDQVIVRSREGKDELALQIDTDEANAAGVETGDYGEILIDKK